MRLIVILALVVIVTLFALTLEAQTPGPKSGTSAQSVPGKATRFLFPPTPNPPEVHPDKTVTFCLRAPQAKAVELVGEVLQGKPPQPMTKDAQGIWSVMIGPLPRGKRLVELFKEKGINAVWADYPGGHVFSVWRNHLNYTAPMLFR